MGGGKDDFAKPRRWYAEAWRRGCPEAYVLLFQLDRSEAFLAPNRAGSPARAAVKSSEPPPAAKPSAPSALQVCGRILGQWRWRTGDIPGVLTFGQDNRVGAAQTAQGPHVLKGTWSCNPAEASFVVRWENGVVENIVMAADNKSVSGFNNFGAPIRGEPVR